MMTTAQAILVLRGALAQLMENSTFSAYAGDNCRQCKKAGDGGCTDPHDQDCTYWVAYQSAQNALKETEAHVSSEISQERDRYKKLLEELLGAQFLESRAEIYEKIRKELAPQTAFFTSGKLLDDSSVFAIPAEKAVLVEQWIKTHPCSLRGKDEETAIGGRITYSFTDTSIGQMQTVKCACGAKHDVDYDY